MAASNPDRSKLLSGITVLDFTHALAGPTCTRILSDLGAEVIKLEPAPNGEFGRSLFPVEGGLGSMFLYTCAGKKSLCVDLKKPDGMKIATGLIAKVDVMVENFAPGVMARLGLDYESVARDQSQDHHGFLFGFWPDRSVIEKHELRHHWTGHE